MTYSRSGASRDAQAASCLFPVAHIRFDHHAVESPEQCNAALTVVWREMFSPYMKQKPKGGKERKGLGVTITETRHVDQDLK